MRKLFLKTEQFTVKLTHIFNCSNKETANFNSTNTFYTMDRLLNMLGGGGGRAAANPDAPVNDTAETIHISSLSLLKMLKHGRAGVPMEVMGLMLGEFIDDYTVRVVDVVSIFHCH